MASPEFRTDFDPRQGERVELRPGLSRIVADNGGPFTFHGTNTYLLGEETVALIDPGPPDEKHLAAIIKAIGGRKVSHIIVTHTHMDHSPLAKPLQAKTGAPILAEGGHRPARDLHLGEINPLDASADMDFVVDHAVANGDMIDGDGWQLRAIFTPGHTANHMAFAWEGTDALFSGDHVMAWATSIVAPPDGSMADYMASLDVMMAEGAETYFPGHGGRLANAPKFVRGLRAHRRMRETAILDQVNKGRETIPDMVSVIYRNTDTRLHKAAGLSVLAHLEDLVANGKVRCDGVPGLSSHYHSVV